MERRLAAILAADVVGYSRLIEQDEAGTLAALQDRRKSILQPLVTNHHGRIVKVMGDGVLVEFASAVNAVACAVELQTRMGAANEGIGNNRRIVLRVGINLGDVIVEGGDLYGDGVIIAARLQELAEPSGICVTGKVYEEVRRKLDLVFDDAGERALKNIAEPLHVYRVVGAREPEPDAWHLPLPDKPSIAVLPFTNLSGDPEQEYFSDGITEDIITELSRFRELFVIARNSSFQYRGKQVDLRRIGRELGVQFVVEGSIRVLGTRVRVTAQLIDAMSGNHVWAERYDRNMQDIFALQDELANGVAASVGARVEAAGRARTVRLSSSALKAYDLILRAKASWMKMSRSSNEERRTFLQRAIEVDPTNAQAHAYYAHTHFLDYMAGWVADPDRSLRDALELAKRAVTLDDDDITAQWVLGLVHLHNRRYVEARGHMEKAYHLNPNDAWACRHYGYFLSCVGELDKAIEQFEIARRRNPLDHPGTLWLMGMAYFTARRYHDAITVLSLINEPINEVRVWLAASYAGADRIAEAKTNMEEFLRVAEGDMVHFPGRRLKDWYPYLRGIVHYQDQRDFDHLFAALHKAGLPE